MKPEEFEKLLKNHDWYYLYSDDPAAYSRGAASAGTILSALENDPTLQELYDRYHPNRKEVPEA